MSSAEEPAFADAAPADAPKARPPGIRWAIVSLFVALSALSIPLLAPQPDGTDLLSCSSFRPLVGDRGYVDVCDYRGFWYLAEHPGQLLEPGETRQTRPLFVLMGTVSRTVASPMVELFGSHDPTAPTRGGYTGLNVALLALAVWLCGRLLRSVGVAWTIIAPIVIVLVVNDVTKAFVWTAHTQMFQILVPLVLVAMNRQLLDPAVGRYRRLLIASGVGTLVLAYGSFIVALPIMLISRYLAHRRSGSLDRRAAIVDMALISVAFVTPMLLWVGIVFNATDGFYIHEMSGDYRHLLWIIDAVRSGPSELLSQAATFTRQFLHTFVNVEVAPFLMIFCVAFVSYASRRREHRIEPPTAAATLQLACLVTAGALAVFIWALGFYQVRLTFALVPVFLCFAAVEARERSTEWSFASAGLLAAASGFWIVLHLVQKGPFS